MAQKGRVKAKSGLNLRDKPNGEKVGVLAHNEEFDILDEVTFFRVKATDGKLGYVHGDYIEKLPSYVEPPLVEIKEKLSGEFKAVTFVHDCFVGDPANVDQDFLPEMNRLADYANQCQLKVWVTSSLRPLSNQIDGAIVKPASKSCHHIGHAIDFNLLHGGVLYNSKALAKSNHHELPEDVVNFFGLIRNDDVLRWGGDFQTEDQVHIDDNFFGEHKDLYQKKVDDRIQQMGG